MKVLKFGAVWCPPCKVLKTMLSGFDAAPMEEIDVDSDDERITKFNIKSIPVLMIVDNEGNELWRKIGVTSKFELETQVKKYKK